MKKIVFGIATFALITFAATFAFAQEDQSSCKDHVFFNRMPNFYLSDCSENFNEFEVVVGNSKKQTIEGAILTNTYYIKDGIEKLPSAFQIMKNYENAVLANGGERVYLSSKYDDEGFIGATFKMSKEGNTYWVTLYNFNGGEAASNGYRMSVIKIEGMKQEVTANEMFEKVNSGNALTLYINFDTGKSSIKSESQKVVDELYKMVNENPSLKIVIEGHTDNVGSKTSNQTLSEQRAASIKQALVNKGISSERIKTVGYGQDKPISDNTTEDGKAKNRRVEIKKM